MNQIFSERYFVPWAILLSLLLHLAGALVYDRYGQSIIWERLWPETAAPPAPPPEDRLEFELVELPADAPVAEPPRETSLASTQSSVARDQIEPVDDPTELPFSEGLVESKRILPSGEREQEGVTQGEETDRSGATEPLSLAQADDPSSDFRLTEDGFLPAPQRGQEERAWRPETMLQPRFRNLDGAAQELGDISLSTWNWDYAPYLIAMQRKIRRNWYPPAAFVLMGLIEGETQLRFKVMRDGTIRDLEVLDHLGHESLERSSVNAIKGSAFFDPLPDHFPDSHLELIYRMRYIVIKD